MNDAPLDQTIDVDWVQGSALMARRDVYAQVGGLDEGYVMYSEELDWCKRAKDAGWRVVFLADAQIQQDLRVRRQLRRQFAQLTPRRVHRPQNVQRSGETVTGEQVLREDDVA